MLRPDHGEVPSIERRDDLEAKPLGKCHDRRIDSPQRQIAISGYELSDPYPIACENRCRSEVSRGEIAEESHFCPPSEASFDQI